MTLPSARIPMRVLVVAASRHPIREPHAGGLEAVVWDRVRALRTAGHDVTLVAAHGSDFLDGTPRRLRLPAVSWGRSSPSDEAYPAGYLAAVDVVHDRLVEHLVERRDAYDIVENHSLHPTPVRRSREHGIPTVTTLHTPPLPELVAAARHAGPQHRYVAVSRHTAAQWGAYGVDATVATNTVDPAAWPLGPGGDELVWFGRIVPEKGPHLAIETARSLGRPLTVAGRVGDVDYFDAEIAPRLGDGVRLEGPMRRAALARLVGGSSCALVTPRWDEPFGLVLVEALLTGTPVAAFARGGVVEVLEGMPGARLVAPDDVRGLALAAEDLLSASVHDRLRIREHAIARFASAAPVLALREQARRVGRRSVAPNLAAAP